MSATLAPTRVTTVDIVAANVRAEAGRLGLTQIDIADALGVNSATVSKRWYGRRQWQLEDLDAVASLLGVTVADLVTPSKNSPAMRHGEHGLLRLDSNQQPSDYRFALDAGWVLQA